MVGNVLPYEKCIEIVRNMSQLRNPYMCAHGRPTMRFLFDIKEMKSWHID